MEKMEKFYISKEEHKFYNTFLKVEDIENIALEASKEYKISVSTLYNVLNRKYPLNDKTKIVQKYVNVYLYKKLAKLSPQINAYMSDLAKTEEVDRYIKNIDIII